MREPRPQAGARPGRRGERRPRLLHRQRRRARRGLRRDRRGHREPVPAGLRAGASARRGDGSWRTIRVEVSGRTKRYAVRARQGYRATAAGEVSMRDAAIAVRPGARSAALGARRRSRPRRSRRGAATQQPPVFGVGVDVVAVDASVVDAEGRPVLGLGPEDFRIEVDGQAPPDRLGRVPGPRPRAARGAPAPGRRTSAATRTRRGAGWCCCSSTAGTSAAAAAARS